MAERKKKPVKVTEASVRRWGAARRDFCPSDAFLFGHKEPGFAPDEKRVDEAVSAIAERRGVKPETLIVWKYWVDDLSLLDISLEAQCSVPDAMRLVNGETDAIIAEASRDPVS